MLNLRQLQCAVALSDTGSFQLAAQKLGITPSGLTQSIQRLESHYGCALFTRRRTGVSPTVKGAIIIEGAQAIIQRADAMDREMELANNPKTGQLNIGVDPTLANTLMAPALVQLMNDLPRVSYNVINGHRPALNKLLESREIDFFLSYPMPGDQAHKVESIEFSIPAPVLVGRSEHPLSTRPKRKIHEYFAYPRLGARLPEWYSQWAKKELLREGLDIDPKTDYELYADDLGLMKNIVQRTDALMGLYREDAKLELNAGVLIELNPMNWPERVPVQLITAAERPLAVATEKLVDVIIAAIPSKNADSR